MSRVVKFTSPNAWGVCVHLVVPKGMNSVEAAYNLVCRARRALRSNRVNLAGHYATVARWTGDYE